jgi:hypothetical protein
VAPVATPEPAPAEEVGTAIPEFTPITAISPEASAPPAESAAVTERVSEMKAPENDVEEPIEQRRGFLSRLLRRESQYREDY